MDNIYIIFEKNKSSILDIYRYPIIHPQKLKKYPFSDYHHLKVDFDFNMNNYKIVNNKLIKTK